MANPDVFAYPGMFYLPLLGSLINGGFANG